MTPLLPLALGATTSVLAAHERHSRQQAERLAAALLETLLNAIDANDRVTGAHVRRVARYALILADAADLDEAAQHKVERIALFHDIGKIHEALFDIIHEETKLTPSEKAEIATHTTRGAKVLQPLASFYPELPEGVLSHHECWNGSGYPRGLRGEAIPLAARIVAIADTFDAVTHARRYKPSQTAAVGAEVIAKGAGTQFDPDLADLFLCPPVFACVSDTMHRCTRDPYRDDRPRGDRVRDERRGQKQVRGPDIPFRWRNPIEREA